MVPGVRMEAPAASGAAILSRRFLLALLPLLPLCAPLYRPAGDAHEPARTPGTGWPAGG